MLTLTDLRAHAETGVIDTVLVAAADIQGRLQGKRCAVRYFLDEVVEHATPAGEHLLAAAVEPAILDGAAISSLDLGYDDFALRPDIDTLRLTPWQPGSAMVLCDLEHHHNNVADRSPRQVLRRQLDRLANFGLRADIGTELEFLVFDESYDAAWHAGYRDLTPVSRYIADYSLLATARVEPLLRRIRNDLNGAGMCIDSARGQYAPGQQLVTFRVDDALAACDNHTIFRTAAKEIAALENKSITFMAKFDEHEGNSCRLHISLRTTAGGAVLAGDDEDGFSATMRHFLAGQLACLRELTYLFAPNINSYKRFVSDTLAPTAVAWSRDNRTCALRVVGRADRLRIETRVPGADVNPYLAVAALIAAGLHGIENRLEAEPAFTGNAYGAGVPTLPRTLRDAADLFGASAVARNAFGDDMVAHYLSAAWAELGVFDAVVTDWERNRGFERL
jgi:glutamine synthetase